VELRAATYNIKVGSGGDNVFDLDRTARPSPRPAQTSSGCTRLTSTGGAQPRPRRREELVDRLDMHVGFALIYSLDPAAAGEPHREYGVALPRCWSSPTTT
jgi:hypothetical protein